MRLKEKLLRIFGDIKLQKWPPFLYYEPGDYYQVSGAESARIAAMLKPGDLLLRGYRNYLDGLFIPGEYSHTGIYTGAGTVTHAVAEGVCTVSVYDFLRCDRVCVLRPDSCVDVDRALERLRHWLGRPYDFDFQYGDEAFYCHELAAAAYRGLARIRLLVPYLGFIRFCGMQPKFLAESFLDSPDFRVVIEFNPGKKPDKQEQKP